MASCAAAIALIEQLARSSIGDGPRATLGAAVVLATSNWCANLVRIGGLLQHVVRRSTNCRGVDEGFYHALNIVLLIVLVRIILMCPQLILLILLVEQELSQRVATLASYDGAAQWRGCINYELALEDLAVNNGCQRLAEVIADFEELLSFDLKLVFHVDFLSLAQAGIIV